MKLAAIAALVALLPVAALADSPQNFIRKAIKGDNSEIMLGRFAADHASNPAVRRFGRMLAEDHRMARMQAVPVARRLGVHPPTAPMAEARDERDKLRGMRGRAFDREFVRYMVDDHRKDIDDFRDEAGERHGAASALAARQLPTLRKHLNTALSLRPRF
jgi:putative membrane protein